MPASGTARSPWECGHRALLGRAPLLALLALLAGVALLVVVLVSQRSSETVVGLAGGADGAEGASATAADAPAVGALAEVPTARTGLGFLQLDDPIERAVAELGPPDHELPDINGAILHTWALAGGAEVGASADAHGIVGLSARVPADAPVEVAAYGGVVLGRATPAEVVAAWGDHYDVREHEGDDFVLRYIECAGPFPVVVKFDQPGGGDVRWDEPVTSVLIAYADAEPGTHGCPAA